MTDKRPAVFLDRDGTINLDAGYVDRLERFEIYPFAVDAIPLFKQAGYLGVVLTNQAGVADGMYGEEVVATLADYLADRAATCAIEAELGKIYRDGFKTCLRRAGPAASTDLGTAGRSAPGPAALNLAGRTDVPQLAGVLALCAAFVSNDSGAMHLASAVGTPVVALFGPTDERVTAPVDARARVLTAAAWCRPCLLRECPLDHRCMNGIDAGAVARAAGELL